MAMLSRDPVSSESSTSPTAKPKRRREATTKLVRKAGPGRVTQHVVMMESSSSSSRPDALEQAATSSDAAQHGSANLAKSRSRSTRSLSDIMGG